MTCLPGFRTRALKIAALSCCVVAVSGCPDDDSGGSGENADTEIPDDGIDVSDGAEDDDGVLAVDFEPICEPGAVRCAGGDGLETCAPTGAEWVFDPCGDNRTCEACNPGDNCTEGVDRCVGLCEAMSLVPSSAGCEFIANRQLHLLEDVPDAVIIANPDEDATATVELFQIDEGTNVEALIDTVTLGPSDDYTLQMSNDFVAGDTTFLRSGGMFRIRSDFPIVAYQHSPFQNHVGNDSSMLLPDDVLGTLYVVPSYNPEPRGDQLLGVPSYFEVISLTKDNWVNWTPPVPTFRAVGIDDILAGELGVKEDLNRYDTLRIAASNEFDEILAGDRDLSGTVVRSKDPIWVAAGAKCASIPARVAPDTGSCDPISEVLIPVQHWGTEYVAMHPPLRENENHFWRVYSGGDGVTFTTEPSVLTEENCADPAVFADGWCTLPKLGSWIEIEVAHGESFVVRGETAPNDAIMLVGYLQSRRLQGDKSETSTALGDSAMYQTTPSEQWLKRYVFRTAQGYQRPDPEDTNRGDFVQIVRPVGGPSVFVDDIGVQNWEPAGDFMFEFATVLIDTGAHTATSSGVFGVSLFGYSDNDIVDPENCLADDGTCASSYAYPGGMQSIEIFIP